MIKIESKVLIMRIWLFKELNIPVSHWYQWDMYTMKAYFLSIHDSYERSVFIVI